MRDERLWRVFDVDLSIIQELEASGGAGKPCALRASHFGTGGAGFIGSAVVRHLLHDTDARVVNIDKLTYAANLDSLPGANRKPQLRI